jgi:uncharacterized protein YjlB
MICQRLGDRQKERAMAGGERDAATVETYRLEENGAIPNNAELPLLVYRAVLPQGGDPAAACEELFRRNGWGGGWRDGIFSYHHFHATAHEALGIVRGGARVRFGGEGGPVMEVRAGDVVVVPAGVAHKNEGASGDLLVVGAYPDGRDRPDLCTGKPEERERARARIPLVARPAADPVFGAAGPLVEAWRSRG